MRTPESQPTVEMLGYSRVVPTGLFCHTPDGSMAGPDHVTPPSRRRVPAGCRRYDATPFSSPFRVWRSLMRGCSENEHGHVPFPHVILERSEESHVAGEATPHPAATTKHGFVEGRRKHGLRTPESQPTVEMLGYSRVIPAGLFCHTPAGPKTRPDAETPPSRRRVPAGCRRYDATPFSSPFRVWEPS